MLERTKLTLAHLFQAGVAAAKGDHAVQAWVSQNTMQRPTHILAAGKAAVAMFEGLPEDWSNDVPTLLITKTDHIGDTRLGPNVTAIESSHPVPDQASLDAGQKAVSFVGACSPDSRLLMLVSGGASSLVEHLNPDVSYDELVRLTSQALGDGLDIGQINSRRKEISAIKGGKLLAQFKGAEACVLAISDVYGDSVDVIGSGIGGVPQDPGFDYSAHIIASNAQARDAVIAAAQNAGLHVNLAEETMYDDVAEVAKAIADKVAHGPAGLYLFGGEPTVVLPENPGQGGRNQALALELARHVAGQSGICGLVAGTDGTDGPTDAAGGTFDGTTFHRHPGAADALLAANSGTYLARADDLYVTGPTGTNVMDLALVIKEG